MTNSELQVNVWRRFFSVLLKCLLFILFVVLFFVVGLFIGYAVIGDGQYWEVLNQDTWAHILSFIK
ncbi:DNA-directed RNA polymerase subunit beta [Aerococcaceae bacterium DSM 111020]|nr:DNA-directed RNA polymerase subunit beta [Aerococcaceae bacterium DSM 111020]